MFDMVGASRIVLIMTKALRDGFIFNFSKKKSKEKIKIIKDRGAYK
jgi:hypothetical protein